jgi:nicotinamidase-related amidase/predicted GNAT family acetyltransferase
VAIDGGVVVGFASGLHYHHPDKPRPQLWIDEVGVAAMHRGRGIGRRLVEQMFEHARDLGCDEAWVLTERDNAAANRLYASVGMAPQDAVMYARTLERRDVERSAQALLVVDVLAGIFELPVPLYEPDAFLANVRGLVERARAANVPVVYIQHVGRPGSPLVPGAPGRAIHPAIAPLPGEPVIEKVEPDAFHGSALGEELRRRDVRELIVCGFATQDCVDATVRSAFARGFRVVLAAGAHTTTANRVLTAAQIVAHHEVVLARFAQVTPTQNIRFDG